jgi:sarcosine oxidase
MTSASSSGGRPTGGSTYTGHGAKFAPLIGDIAADVATGTGRAPERFAAAAITAASSGV